MGVYILGSANNTIGGTAAAARNVISGNGAMGIDAIFGSATGNLVQGNYIGTDVTGTASLRNGNAGVWISAANNTIGGTAAGARNVISGNRSGITVITSSAIGNLVQGNYIGTDVTGTTDLGNSDGGVTIGAAKNNTIGGTVAAARNIISGNDAEGIELDVSGTIGNHVQGNYIGTNAAGTAGLGNSAWGVWISHLVNNSTIGGTAAGARNVISSNHSGVAIYGPGNQVQGNYIGTNAAGTASLGNSHWGVIIGSANNTIGGTTATAGNIIGFNGVDGVVVEFNGDVGNAILSNSIHSNSGLGINFGYSSGVTANDGCDSDTGQNNRQNFPVLTSASTTSIQGTLNSTANTTFTIQFFANSTCDPSGYGEGQSFIGSITATTNASCNASFSFPTSLSPGQVVTATATDPSNNTSEFSKCLAVGQSGNPLSITTSSLLPNGSAGASYSQPLTATGGTLPYTWSVSSGALPTGLALGAPSGAISGTPTTAGTFSFTVTVSDAAQTTASKAVALTIQPQGSFRDPSPSRA